MEPCGHYCLEYSEETTLTSWQRHNSLSRKWFLLGQPKHPHDWSDRPNQILRRASLLRHGDVLIETVARLLDPHTQVISAKVGILPLWLGVRISCQC
ncbi:hypothetical protein N7532_005854 [Penicillium argentinense]|uniref:Uncharacterized protein n=1 Tax=Penicillium argentinense TaxID=1131581 RepID=A0A9W9FEP5_9EURO|nr:uncharacterized protein N7532_005854 [Penicillium argentinense]KAJ5098853.1 hypothetical protein N7532_005854 [Penicillium argentinense]